MRHRRRRRKAPSTFEWIPPEGTPPIGVMAEVEAYAVLIEKWAQAEKSAEEDDREGLGLVAVSIRRFLGGRPWVVNPSGSVTSTRRRSPS
jgi:hypothetical protein